MILFAAIKLPPRTTKRLVKEQKGVSGARWSDADKLHITLGYFGEVDDDRAEILDEELARKPLPSLEIELRGAGHFGKAEPHAIWIGVAPNPALTRLHEHCKNAARRAGIQMEKRLYRPHVTLAYLKPFSPIDRIISFEKRLADFETLPFLVDEFFLFSSHRKVNGPNIYRMEASYPLIGRAE
ncbi:RNA 2',3'-cyclic phosphodiesterase [Litorimonas sp. RW-G-Af-16]|uniref:RNA 2',3'-cyclic phosphodiesterase n=1 Tax=Litorimonas sp. RW-G-Af-16 TaxID=3241168 RepID=UPI00390CA33A